MNKKIFTLLAVSLTLFITAFAANAARPWLGDTVRYLPEGTGKGAYHLVVSSVGNTLTQDSSVLYIDEEGYLQLGDSLYVFGGSTQFRSALWCVNVKEERLGQVPAYTFINKEFGMDLAVANERFSPAGTSVFPNTPDVPMQKFRVGNDSTDILIGGSEFKWNYSRTYNTVELQNNRPLYIQVGNNEFLTFAKTSAFTSDNQIRLVKVTLKQLEDPTDQFYQNYLVRFNLRVAAPRVLTADDFNSKLGEDPDNTDGVKLSFDPGTKDIANVFTENLKAVGGSLVQGEYLRLRKADGTSDDNASYITLLDSADANYYNQDGPPFYPKLDFKGLDRAGSGLNRYGQQEFRLVYYPSEDSLIINVRGLYNKQLEAVKQDSVATGTGVYNRGNEFYTQNIWDYLIVRLQDLGDGLGRRVVTVANRPLNTRIHFFGKQTCELIDQDRTTVDPDLYVITDQLGRYLVLPLYGGDFAPQWVYLTDAKKEEDPDAPGKVAKEIAFRTPAYQWVVTKSNDSSDISKIHLTNREFDNVTIEYVQIFKDYSTFGGLGGFVSGNFTSYHIQAQVKKSGFEPVKDDPAAYAVYKSYLDNDQLDQLPAEIWEKLYRNSPYLGYKYIGVDTLDYYGYALNYRHYADKNYYLGVDDTKPAKDTTIYALKDKTFFQLELSEDFINAIPQGGAAASPEEYGVGYVKDSLGAYKIVNDKEIAKLVRFYYYFKISDYFRFSKNDNYLILDDNGRYAYADSAKATARPLERSSFYLRFTYVENDREYYTLLDRIPISSFTEFTRLTGLTLTESLKSWDKSHSGTGAVSVGAAVLSIDDLNLFARAQVKTLGTERASSFALSRLNEPLYRRFDDNGLNGSKPGDEPELVKFYRARNPFIEYLYEDRQSIYSSWRGPNWTYTSGGINFLGVENSIECAEKAAQDASHILHHYAIYVDTAYVNRGTGWIKPQYLLVVDPEIEAGGVGCTTCGDSVEFSSYVYGRYLFNATDTAGRNSTISTGKPVNDDYIWDTKWDRLAFADAIHHGDTLYLLNGNSIDKYKVSDGISDKKYVNFKKVYADKSLPRVYLGNNFHKDYVFSFRFVERQIEGASDNFYIESETANRTKTPVLAPLKGGWIKIQNHVPVISRGAYGDYILDAEVWNVEPTTEASVANDPVKTAEVTVISGTGSITIQNASGKKAVVSNVLGQTIANTVLTSDNVTIDAPKGVVVVAIEGENAVKAVVK